MRAVRKQRRQPGQPRTMSIPEAGWEFYGLSENAAYAAAKRGEIPYVLVGNRKRVPIALMEAKLASCGGQSAEPLDEPPLAAAAPE